MLAKDVTLYFIRHGETDWNAIGRYQGQRDIPLNSTGRAQAQRNGEVLAAVLKGEVDRFDFVASPLLRTRETMEIGRGAMLLDPLAFRTDDRLKEIDYGVWEGELYSELPQKDPVGFAARKADTWGWQPQSGESYKMLSDRIAGWLEGVDRDTVVVSHGGVSRVLRGLVLNLGPNQTPFLEVPQDKVLKVCNGEANWF